MATTQQTVDQRPKVTPIITDEVVMAQASDPTKIKTTTYQHVYNLFKGMYDNIYGNPDFYQYSIVRTVDGSGNLTVALKNYLWNDPTPTAPVKIMIGGVVRTITSALSFTKNSGTNWLNLWSAELATKEVDLFPYLLWETTSSSVKLFVLRFPSANTIADITWSVTNEKWIIDWWITQVLTDPVVNIGRFNATLSAGAGYTWSIPATSVIVNKPINETRWLDFNSNIIWFSSLFVSDWKYKLSYNQMEVIADEFVWVSNSTSFTFTLPFSTLNITKRVRYYTANGIDNWTFLQNTLIEVNQNSATHNCYKSYSSPNWTASWVKSMYLPYIIIQI